MKKTKLKFTQKLNKRKEKKKKQEIIKNIKDTSNTRKERETTWFVFVFVFGSFMLFSIQIIHNANSTQSLWPNPTQHNPRQISPTHFLFSLLKSSTTLFQFISDQVHIYILRFLVSFSHILSLILMHFILILTIMDVNFNVFLDSMQ